MIVIGLILAVFAAGFCCWLLFTFAIYAFPLFVGATAALAALHGGGGASVAVLAGFAAAAITVVIAQIAFALATSSIIRSVIAFSFAAPAAFAGYHATLGLLGVGLQSDGWRHLLAIVGAILVAGAAGTRVMVLRPRP